MCSDLQNFLKKRRLLKTRTNKLYEIAANSGVQIVCFDLPNACSVSVMTGSGNCYIGIDPFQIDTEKQERVHLAHELGHCVTGSFYNMYSDFDVRERHETRADRRAAAWLVPVEELKFALSHGITEAWSLAEYFSVTEEFIQKTIYNYRIMGLLSA